MKVMKLPHSQQGINLIELMVVLTIVGILAMVAAPSMQDTLKLSGVRGHVRDFNASLMYARGEAVSRNKRISMCPSADGASCDAANNWSNGWIIFIDDGAGGDFGDGEFDAAANEQLLRVTDYSGNNSLVVTDGDSGSALDFLSWNYRGFTADDARALATVCVSSEADDLRYARGLLIERSGRVIGTADSDNDMVHESVFEDDNGNVSRAPLSCT